jgi:uncharacterized protein
MTLDQGQFFWGSDAMERYDFSLIHKFQMEDEYIVLDINSGIIHSFSKAAWDFLLAWEKCQGRIEETFNLLREKYATEELAQVWRELESLIEEGMLFSRDETLDAYELPEKTIIKALCLHVAHDCNLRCRYCFAGTGNFGGERGLMDLETGKKALEFLFEASGPRKHVEVDYFGGEPLLNFPVVKELIQYGKARARDLGKILKQTLTTNAVLLTREVMDFLNQEEISLVLSLDGRQQVHDRMRPFSNNKGSYNHVLPAIKALVEERQGNNYYVRGTYTRFNLDFCRDVLHLVEEGFNQVSVEPVVASPEHDYALRDEDLPVLKEQYELLTKAWLAAYRQGQPFNFFHFNISLDKGPCLPKRLSGCGAGHEYLAVSPEGYLYPCHQFVGKEEFKLGSVKEGITNTSWGKRFQSAHVLNKAACRQCWARFFCSGGCHANAYNFNQDIFKPYGLGCELEKKRLECAIFLQVKCSEERHPA